MAFPIQRMRRLRVSETVRRMVRQVDLTCDDLIAPLFVRTGREVESPIASLPGQFQFSIDRAVVQCGRLHELGIPAVLLFGIPANKDEIGSSSWRDEGIVQQAIRAIKSSLPELVVIADVCFCEYTTHGHCGVLRGHGASATVDNDATLVNLARQSVSLAKAGADMLAPSDMMDGRVGVIRKALDDAGFQDRLILSYAAKFASAFYGPFREAAGSAPQFGDRRGYQMDPANGDEAIREVALDVEEGADIVMVKPALPCLDVIWRVKQRFTLPTAAYQVSGEYAMIKAAAERGWIDEKRIVLETLTAIRRAGADMIVTYFAAQAAEWMAE